MDVAVHRRQVKGREEVARVGASSDQPRRPPRTRPSLRWCAGVQERSVSKWRWFSGDEGAVRGSVASRSGAGGCAPRGREKKSTLTFFYRYVP